MKQRVRLTLTLLFVVAFTTSISASDRAGRYELQPFGGTAFTSTSPFSSGAKVAVLLGAQVEHYLTNSLAIGVSYSRANYADFEDPDDHFADVHRIVTFHGPITDLYQAHLKLRLRDLGPLTPFLKGSVGHVKIHQEFPTFSSPNGFTFGAVSGSGVAYGIGAGASLTIAHGWSLFSEAMRITSDAIKNQSKSSEGDDEDFWILRSGLSLWL